MNTIVGDAALHVLTTGSNNIAIGANAGTNYTSSESNNIIISSTSVGPEVAGESNVIRIGKTGTQTKAFIAGIRGVTTVNNDAISVLIDSAGQLGTVSSSKRFKHDINSMDADSEIILST